MQYVLFDNTVFSQTCQCGVAGQEMVWEKPLKVKESSGNFDVSQ